MDTTSITTTVTTTITHLATPLAWIIIFTGLIMYWMKQMQAAKKSASGLPWLTKFWDDNFLEIPFSFIACIALVLFGMAIPPTNFATSLADFMLGFGSSSAINGLITSWKTPK